MAIASSQRLQNFHSGSRDVTMLLPGIARDVSEFVRDGLQGHRFEKLEATCCNRVLEAQGLPPRI